MKKNKYLNFEDFTENIQSKRKLNNKKSMIFRLSSMYSYLEYFNNPQKNLKFIHIAGTNGKGSTLAYLKKSLTSLSYTVALYTSPHLLDLCERWQINYQKIPQETFWRLAKKIVEIENQFIEKNSRATIFEFFTILAILYFAQEDVDFVLWETGLGGHLDSTNIVNPILSLITYIGLDHQNILGSSLEEIAREKAGIIKNNIPCITTEEKQQLIKIIEQKTNQCQSKCFVLGKDFHYSFEKEVQKLKFTMGKNTFTLTPPLLGEHQYKNISLCLATLLVLYEQDYISAIPQMSEVEQTQWLGRLQYLTNGFLLDCAHNIDGIRSLLNFVGKEKQYNFLLSFLEDKSWKNFIDELLPYSQTITLFQMSKNERTLNMDEIKQYIHSRSPNILVNIIEQVKDFLELGYDLSQSIACGSLILIAELLVFFDE